MDTHHEIQIYCNVLEARSLLQLKPDQELSYKNSAGNYTNPLDQVKGTSCLI